jgi:hypothetical protein
LNNELGSLSTHQTQPSTVSGQPNYDADERFRRRHNQSRHRVEIDTKPCSKQWQYKKQSVQDQQAISLETGKRTSRGAWKETQQDAASIEGRVRD